VKTKPGHLYVISTYTDNYNSVGYAMAETVTDISPQRPPWSDSRHVHVGFVLNKVALGRFFSKYFGFPLLVP